MKTITALFALVTLGLNTNAFAGALSPELEKLVLDAAYENCNLGRALSVEVESVKVEAKSFDQGKRDYFYDITLDVKRTKINDADELLTDKINVKAAEYAIYNPSVAKYEVLSVRSKICN